MGKEEELKLLRKRVADQQGQIQRLTTLFSVVTFIALAMVLLFSFWASYNLRQLKSQLAYSNGQLVNKIKEIPPARDGHDGISIIGRDGLNGRDGRDGRNGKDGTDGSSVTAGQVAAAVTQYLALHPVIGVQGLQGTPGQDGVTQQLQVDVLTCKLQAKLSTNDLWTTLAQLPKPCDPNVTSSE